MADKWWIYFCFFLSFYRFETANTFALMVRVRPSCTGGRNAGSISFAFLLHHLFSNFNVCKNHFGNLLKHNFLGPFSTDSDSVHWAREFACLTSS